jgi:hypothetical protein
MRTTERVLLPENGGKSVSKQNLALVAGASALSALAGVIAGAAAASYGARTALEGCEPAPGTEVAGGNPPAPLPYIMDPATDYLCSGADLRNGMVVIEEEGVSRRVSGGNVLVSQAVRAEEPYIIENLRNVGGALVEYEAVWDDGYREYRCVSMSTRFIARKEGYGNVAHLSHELNDPGTVAYPEHGDPVISRATGHAH